MKILILGGNGFLGKNLNFVFSGTNYIIYNESRSTGCNMLEYDSLLSTVKRIKPNIIINSAAHVGGVDYVFKNCAEVCSDNTLMFVNLYKVIKEVDTDILLINPLSNCSYPGSTLDILEESHWWDGPLHPSVSGYGVTKKIAFELSEAYKKQYKISTINLIIPNAYGPFDYFDAEKVHAMNGIIIRMLKSIKNSDKTFKLWGSGTPVREWVYMMDVANLIKYIIDNDIKDLPNPLNIGQEIGFSINDTVKMIQEILKTNFIIEHDLTKANAAPKKIMSSKLFRKHFPNFRFTDPITGIKNTIKYYENSF
jgi:GDP-L-fucose synthase